MLTIEIHHNKTEQYCEAIETMISNGGNIVDFVCLLNIDDIDVLSFYKENSELLSVISEWDETRTLYDGKPFDLCNLLSKLKSISDCVTDCKTSSCSGCKDCNTKEGWGCKKLTSVSTATINNRRCWYKFGFWLGNQWVINKNQIKELLNKEIEYSGIAYCPNFKYEKIEKALKSIPKYIIPDGIFFEKQGNSIRHILSVDEVDAQQTLAIQHSLEDVCPERLCNIKRNRVNKVRKMFDKYNDGFLRNGFGLS